MSHPVYICDIDGTVADLSHRLHFIQKKPADWDAFFKACVDDLPIWDVIHTVRTISKHNYVVLISGRSNAVEEETRQWLADYGVWHEALYMRKAGDHRPDNIVKAELLDKAIADFGNPEIRGVFEDRKQVVDMYRARGLRVFQVAEGNF